MSVNSVLFNTLKTKGLKQSDLAKELNIQQSVVATWKQRGTNPPAEYIVQICDFLGITLYEIFEIENKLEYLENYKLLSRDDKYIVDTILRKYERQETKSSDSKIG